MTRHFYKILDGRGIRLARQTCIKDASILGAVILYALIRASGNELGGCYSTYPLSFCAPWSVWVEYLSVYICACARFQWTTTTSVVVGYLVYFSQLLQIKEYILFVVSFFPLLCLSGQSCRVISSHDVFFLSFFLNVGRRRPLRCDTVVFTSGWQA